MRHLTDTAIRSTKAATKPLKLFDGGGLHLVVTPNGSRLWRLKYRVDGREKLLSFGEYPAVSLKTAREQRDEARRLLAADIDPAEKRKADRNPVGHTFEAIAREYLRLKAKSLSARTLERKTARFVAFVFPRFGRQPISKVTASQLLQAVRAIESRGLNETAHRVRSECDTWVPRTALHRMRVEALTARIRATNGTALCGVV